MNRQYVRFFFLTLFCCLLSACTSSAASTPDAISPEVEGEILVIGDISDEATETIRGTQPLADYLAEQLKENGVIRAEVKIAPDIETMIRWIENGEVDLYFDSPYPVMVISEATGARPILRRLRFGVAEYHSVFFVRADSPIQTMNELQGQLVAFEEAFSTSAYMLPLAYLFTEGFNPVERSDPSAVVAADEIGYVFSRADNTTIQWVISGIIPAGVIDNVTFGRLPEETQAQLRIIAATEDVPRQMVLVRPGMPEPLVTAITEVLLQMDENESGRAALERFQTTAFEEFPEGYDAAMQEVQTLYQLVQTR